MKRDRRLIMTRRLRNWLDVASFALTAITVLLVAAWFFLKDARP